MNINGEQCIVLGEEKLAVISEPLCIGCGICVKVCPFEAITILNLSEELKQDKIHQYGINTFRLYRLPTPRKGQVVGLVGRNGSASPRRSRSSPDSSSRTSGTTRRSPPGTGSSTTSAGGS